MRDLLVDDFARQGAGYVILTDDFIESLRPILAIERLIVHCGDGNRGR